MARSDYRPGRRRKPMISALLDWAAGILIAILLVALGAGASALLVGPGLARAELLVPLTFVVWPVGAAVGVWLSMGRPFSGSALVIGLAATALCVALLAAPLWLQLEPPVLRTLAGVLALLAAPAAARASLSRLRSREADDPK